VKTGTPSIALGGRDADEGSVNTYREGEKGEERLKG
jgi:hypothetical protein